ncbi:aluminum-activated [Perilla frutescens var. hirtella]|uniref:Aluminum-activated n=1 Tax=Perilla frutescens var. hirtella TaxID=608512 RepID=A0AAD4P7M9_PERFH|nr:aluminum-activated [Perilla frutescens var. hirtella]
MRISGEEHEYYGYWREKIEVMKKRSMVLAKSTWMTICRVGQEDPCRVVHALKVGFSLTLVSLLYLLEPFFKGIGQNAIWAVMTVVVVLEFTAGATLCKGLNRGIGTLLAGSLAFFIEYIAQESGQIFRAIFIGTTVFAVGTAATYMRFFPYIKKNYDYGVVIFLLTFNLITVSSYRIHNVLKIAQDRFFMIAIGCGICLLMSLIILPNWSGQHLHNFSVAKLEGLATSIQACVDEYFSNENPNEVVEASSEDPIYKGYKATPRSVRVLFKDPCIRLAGEVSKALMELADSIRKRRQCSPMILSDHLHEALHDLDAALKSQPKLFLGPNANMMALAAATAARQNSSKASGASLSSVKTDSSALLQWKSKRAAREQAKELSERKSLRPTMSKVAITSLDFAEALPFAAFASLLVETVARLDLVIDEVEELGRVANFRDFCAGDEVVVNCQKPERGKKDAPLQNHLPSHGVD